MTTLPTGSTAPLEQRLAEARIEVRQPIDREEIAGIVTAVLTSMEGDVSSSDLKLYGELESLARATLATVIPLQAYALLQDARGLRIGSWVNGEQRQDSTTDDLIFGPSELVEFISQTCTLEPGRRDG